VSGKTLLNDELTTHYTKGGQIEGSIKRVAAIQGDLFCQWITACLKRLFEGNV